MEVKISNPLKEIIYDKKISSLSQLQQKLNELEKSLNDSPGNLIKKAIIDFTQIINPFSQKWKEQEIGSIANDFIDCFCENKINESIEKKIIKIKNPFTRFLIEIDEDFPKDKGNIKLGLKIILLSHNKEILIKYLKEMSKMNLEDIEKEIFNLNFNNPFSIIFIHELLKVLFKESKSQTKTLETIINNMKDIQIFRCNQCFDLLYVVHTDQGTTLSCNNPSHTILNSKEIKQLNNYDLMCCECKKVIKIYFDSYKCIKCKLFVCNMCSKKHYKSCYPSDLINLYDVGYTCEIHSRKYIDTCDMCNKNLCEKCKLYHLLKKRLNF